MLILSKTPSDRLLLAWVLRLLRLFAALLGVLRKSLISKIVLDNSESPAEC
jgi:hypothetical protein